VPKLRLGVAGLGIGGAAALAGAAQSPVTEIVAAADTRKSALDVFRQRYGGRTYERVEDLCADPDVDVVWIATPNQYHRPHVVMAAEHGKHVIGEKPMALSVEECEQMVEAAERNNVQLLCGHTYSMSPHIQALLKEARSGKYGRLISIHAWNAFPWLLSPRVPEEYDLSLGGGVVYRHGPHVIDTIRLLGGGMVKFVRARVGAWMPERPAPGNISAYMEFEDGTPATFVYNGYGYFETTEFSSDEGLRMANQAQRARRRAEQRRALRAGEGDPEAAKEAQRFGGNAPAEGPRPPAGQEQPGGMGIVLASFERGDLRHSYDGVFIYDDEGRHHIQIYESRGVGMLEMQDLYDALYEGKPLEHDGRWGMGTLEVATAIMQSSEQGRDIMLTHQCPVRG
jgi:phthalate 4,5-cis-dihydrodiol dehydrogenase